MKGPLESGFLATDTGFPSNSETFGIINAATYNLVNWVTHFTVNINGELATT